MVYLDYNATTPLAEEALNAMMPYLANKDTYGNPSSQHRVGRRARAAIDNAREVLSSLLKVHPHEIIFTGGGTEANNLAVLGLARARLPGRGTHLITCATEHHAVLHSFEYLRREGFEVTILPVDRFGQVDPNQLSAAIRPETALVSIMSANNETGTLQPISVLAEICREQGVFFHSDMVQSFGKQPISPHEVGVDALSIAAHKFYGPKGVGALFLRSGVSMEAIHFGGSQEGRHRPGTENVAGIVGLSSAAAMATGFMPGEASRLMALRERLWGGLSDIYPEAVCNGHPKDILPNTLNVSFPNVQGGETLLIALDLEGICVSSSSACMVGSMQPSHVLLAMGVPTSLAQSTIRFSLGHFTTEKEIETTVHAMQRVLHRVAGLRMDKMCK
ncbi:Cysteine desulfurase [Candidatus Xiphinematobacter sp. Idaho Grape]|uniref:cysteine desulfurase family protein n=1 Tax=Candidatus Xiphinematobacter sp. Idaho Grape TaxID=1704307 RepID=UPI00070584EB|nr:cysteine desulfurase family protein [Candidatus Xiphinematobacter sp. Idaho Grape]ALJ56288.1 Cysteine desulfurase [Candidatus Xiphinematobacter sp. Idaho Grape]